MKKSALAIFSLIAWAAFSFPAHADTIRQPVNTDSRVVTNTGGQGMNLTFVAPVSGFIYSSGVWLSSVVPNVYNVSYLSNLDGSDETYPDNYFSPVTQNQAYGMDFSSNPFPITAGQSYVLHLALDEDPYPGTNHDIGYFYGSNSTTTVYWGATGTSTAFCSAGCGSMKVPYFFLTTSPLNLNISALYPSATSSILDLPTAQQFCGSTTFGTTSNLFQDVGASFSSGLCLSFAYLFVPSSDSLGQFQTFVQTAQGKIPFSYAYEFVSDFQSLTASSSTNLPTWKIDLSSVDLGSSTPMGDLYGNSITYFSTTTISTYFPDPVRFSLLNIERLAIWFGVVYFFYRRIIPHKPDLISK